jgi:hypothetical protein
MGNKATKASNSSVQGEQSNPSVKRELAVQGQESNPSVQRELAVQGQESNPSVQGEIVAVQPPSPFYESKLF